MSEAAVQDRIHRVLKRRGAWFVKTHGTGVGRVGLPDDLACYRGRFLAIEVKQPGGKPTRLQAHELGRIRRAGGVALVATSPKEVERVLDDIDQQEDA